MNYICSNPPFEFPNNEGQIVPEPIGNNFIKIIVEGHNIGYDIYYDSELKKIFTYSSVK